MITVFLQGAEFFARHGYYPEEQVLGGRYVIDLSVSFEQPGMGVADELNNTVNYERLYTICCEEMKQPRMLIETVAQAIMDRVISDYPIIQHITLTLKKLHPPMKGSVACSGVTLTYSSK